MKRHRPSLAGLLLLAALLAACGGSDVESRDAGNSIDTLGESDAPYVPGPDALSGEDGLDDQDTKPTGGPDVAPDVPLPICEPGERACEDELTLLTCDEGGFAWLAEDCGEDEICLGDACLPLLCEMGERRCAEEGEAWQACVEDGTAWSEPTLCGETSACVEGVCLDQQCEPGDVVCAEASLLTCDEDGLGWTREDCPEGELCFAGQCVECVNADQCAEGEFCDDGRCAPAPVTILPFAPPLGTVTQPYAFELRAAGGLPPYLWSTTAGVLPPGLLLTEEGVLEGTPSQAGEFAAEVLVEDQYGSTDTASLALTVEAYVEGVRITSTSPLPRATEGEAYATQLQVTGGTPPYAWMINQGALPAGLAMDSAGGIAGTPNQAVGDFLFTVRVFDNSPGAPTWDQKDFLLNVEIAPLEIIGDQEYNLLVTKVIILPLLTFIPGVPLIPYNAQLQAKGGLRPYAWSEDDLPSYLSWLIPRSGIPEGLTLAADGRLSGNVGSTDDVISITIPFTQINLQGFFFIGRVTDSQSPAESKTGLFLIPTLPIGG